MKAVLLAAALALCALPCAAQVYKWTDADGKVHFSDKPPPEASRKHEEVKVRVQSFGGAPVIENPAEALKRGARPHAAPQNAQLVMYATSWCGYCRKARAHLAQKGIPYREVDIEASAANEREFKALGGRGVPLFVQGGRTMRGFSAEGLDRFLAQAR